VIFEPSKNGRFWKTDIASFICKYILVKTVMKNDDDEKSTAPSNYLEHDGKPSPKDQVEILKVCALAIGFVGGTTALISRLIELAPQSGIWALVALLALAGSGLSLWAIFLSILAIKGRTPISETKAFQIIAYGLLAIACSWPIAVFASLLIG